MTPLTPEEQQLVVANLPLVAKFVATLARNSAAYYSVLLCRLGSYDDILAEATIALIKAVRHYDPERGSLSTLVYAAVRRRLNTFAKRRHNPPLTDVHAAGHLFAAPAVEDDLPDERDEYRRLLLTRLPPRLRKAVQMRLAGATWKEVREKAGLTADAVRCFTRHLQRELVA